MRSFTELLAAWDGEFVVSRHDAPTGAFLFIAVHSTRLGPASGGTRWRSYERPEDGMEDALRLAAAMSRKMAVLGLPRGGGKAVIAAPPRPFAPAEREGLLLRYGALVESLRGLYGTGPDLGTSSADMDVIRRKTSHVAGCTGKGAGGSGPLTALGVYHGIRAAAARAFGSDSLRDRSVLVQGAGAVGAGLIELLRRDGARVIATDADPARLEALRKEGVATVAPGDAIATECDVFAPCAVGGVLDEKTIPRLRCRVVAGAANNPLASPLEDARRLAARGILYAPDYVINAGGAIALVGLEQMGLSRTEAESRVRGIGDTLRTIFERADARGMTPAEAADAIADERLAGTR